MLDYYRKTKSTLPTFQAHAEDGHGKPVDLSTAVSIIFFMWNPETLIQVTTGGGNIYGDDPTAGDVEYRWSVNEANTIPEGTYHATFVIGFPNGASLVLPVDDYYRIRIGSWFPGQPPV